MPFTYYCMFNRLTETPQEIFEDTNFHMCLPQPDTNSGFTQKVSWGKAYSFTFGNEMRILKMRS